MSRIRWLWFSRVFLTDTYHVPHFCIIMTPFLITICLASHFFNCSHNSSMFSWNQYNTICELFSECFKILKWIFLAKKTYTAVNIKRILWWCVNIYIFEHPQECTYSFFEYLVISASAFLFGLLAYIIMKVLVWCYPFYPGLQVLWLWEVCSAVVCRQGDCLKTNLIWF